MEKDEIINTLLDALASVHKDACMALSGEWDKSDDGFEDQQTAIETAVEKAGLTQQFQDRLTDEG